MKQLTFLVLIMLSCMIRPSQAQISISSTKGEIRGKVLDAKTKKPLDYVSVTLMNSRNKIVAQVLTDDDGNYTIKQLAPDTYKLRVSNIGYLNLSVDDVKVASDQITFQHLPMSMDNNIQEVRVVIHHCCFYRRNQEIDNQKKSELISVQSQYEAEKNILFTCSMQHKSRTIEQKVKESAVKLFNEVRVFPSPTNAVVNVESMYDETKEVVIQNLSGLVVYRGIMVHHLQLEVAGFPLGLYVVTLIDKANDEKSFAKFIVTQ
jgi:5-hydroxyisourate hydrolase-like protein (transthyretin family)